MKHRRDKYREKNRRRDAFEGKRNLLDDCLSCHYDQIKYRKSMEQAVLDLEFQEQLLEAESLGLIGGDRNECNSPSTRHRLH